MHSGESVSQLPAGWAVGGDTATGIPPGHEAHPASFCHGPGTRLAASPQWLLRAV